MTVQRNDWTEDRKAQLTELWAAGFSSSQIAKRLSPFTRSAICGQVRRMGLPFRHQGKTTPIAREVRVKAVRALPPPPPSLEMQPTPFESSASDQCRWMLDDHTICGAKGRPWCDYHRAIVYQPTKKREAA
jgi:hypothetical protein